jgi:hypothetical protein
VSAGQSRLPGRLSEAEGVRAGQSCPRWLQRSGERRRYVGVLAGATRASPPRGPG